MTESKRATWREFVEWVAVERVAFCPGPAYGLSVAASYVESRREAAAALLGLGVRPDVVDKLCGEWIELHGAPWLPKPERVEVGQRWVHDFPIEKPMPVDEIQGDEAMLRHGQWRRVRVLLSDLLTDPRWRYIGNGEAPNEEAWTHRARSALALPWRSPCGSG